MSTRRLFVIACLSGCFVLGAVILSPWTLAARLAQSNGALLVGLLAAAYVVRPFLAFPMAVLTVFVGFRFGVIAGYPVTVAGTAVTCYVPYLIAGILYTTSDPNDVDDAGLLRRLAVQGRRALATTGDLRAVAAARLSPAPADAVSCAAGFADVRRRPYVLGTILGELPWMGFYLGIGASARSLSVANTTLDPVVLLIFAAAGGVLLLSPVVRIVRARTRL